MSKAFPLGFQVTLHDAVAKYWPASSVAKAYYSDVTVADSGQSNPLNTRIQTNAPLIRNGFYLYQSGIDQNAPYRWSVFQVAYDPGLALVSSGFLIMLVGLLWLYTVRFVLRGRKRPPVQRSESP